MPQRSMMMPSATPPIPTSTPRIKNGCCGYEEWPNPQMNPASTTARGSQRTSLRRKGMANMRNVNSSKTAGK